MGASLNPDAFHDSDEDPISPAQAALLKAKGIAAGISDGIDQHWIEAWLWEEFGINVDDVEDLTRGQFNTVLEEMGWET